jgi:hypothetical protein
VALLDGDGREVKETGTQRDKVEHGHPLGSGAQPLVPAGGDAPEDAPASGRRALCPCSVVADVDQVPVPLFQVAEQEEGIGMIAQQLINGQTFRGDGQGKLAVV